MAKTKKPAKASPSGAEKPSDREQLSRSRNIRETIESIAIAFILAFLFRTFEAEAFVIPTGSMAPTLRGMHKDVDCRQCGYRYQASASNEAVDSVKALRAQLKHRERELSAANDPRLRLGLQRECERLRQELAGHDVVQSTCPMCRFTMSVDPREVSDGAQKSYNGDRILVGKFVYELGEPQRWDVIVFKYPGDTKVNYIKRLVGLPGEEVQIRNGDIFVRPVGTDEPFRIARKGDKILPMLQLVHDNAHVPSDLYDQGWPLRWQAWPPGSAAGGWTSTVAADEAATVRQTFETKGTKPGDHWIRYQHYVPSRHDWQDIASGSFAIDERHRPQLITDFQAYNSNLERNVERHIPNYDTNVAVRQKFSELLGLHWVGDLMVQCDVQVASDKGEILLDLVEGGQHFTCRIDVATGRATLAIEGQPDFAPTAPTAVRGPGNYTLALANVDDELTLWIDGERAPFDGPTTYESPQAMRPYKSDKDGGDLAPAGVGSRGAKLTVGGLRIYRDIYYIATTSASNGMITDYKRNVQTIIQEGPEEFAHFLSDPRDWGAFANRGTASFPLDEDRFFVLGDNSPASKDGRLWERDKNGQPAHFVERKLLIGKALCIYWPHSWGRVPGTRIPLPFFPNFADMGLVR